MRTNIMLCFLSDVKTKGREISIAQYQNIGAEKECHTTNESAVRYLLYGANEPVEKLSCLFLVRTNKVAGNITYSVEERDSNGKKMFRSIDYKDKEERTWTHYDYFLHRISGIVHNAVKIAEPIDFDEDKPMEENMNVLIDVASHVRDYAREVRKHDADAEIVLHVDCTGGMRNASMILVALMRLLQYENIHIGKVLYSDYHRDDSSKNRVEEVNPLYSFFDLVAGAEEFVRHGEVTVLNKFFEEREKSRALQDLLASMRKFAEELKLCHYGDLREAITGLGCAIDEFSSASPMDSSVQERQSDELMRQMLGRIKEDYTPILNTELDDIALIRWCIAHDLLQQAMTLVTERVPEVLERSGFLMIKQEYCEDFTAQLAKDSFGRNKGFFLVSEYKIPNAKENFRNFWDPEKVRRIWRKMRQEFLMKFRDNITEDAIHAFVDTSVFELDQEAGAYIPVPLKDAETLRGFLLWLYRMQRSDGNELQRTEEGIAYLKQIEPIYCAAHKNGWENLLTNKDCVIGSKLIKTLCNAGKQDRHCSFLDIEWSYGLCKLYQAGIKAQDEKIAGQILERYSAVKKERNHSNHARAEKGRMTVETLKTIMEQTLEDTVKACQMGKEKA